MASAKKAGYKKIKLYGDAGDIHVYASPRILAAMNDATINMDVYQGVKFGQVLDAVYQQGIKNGRNEVFEGLKGSVKTLGQELPHKNPGRPKKAN